MEQATPKLLKCYFKERHFDLEDTACESLCLYVNMLMQWNKAMNLVGTRTWQDTCRLLIIDSLELTDFLLTLHLPQTVHTWDLGAGAGLPGIPLRIIWHDGDYIMIEAREKRALFLENALARMALQRTTVFHGRIEKFMALTTKKPDLLVSRAFMPWKEACETMRPALHKESIMVFLLKQVPDITTLPNATIYAQHTYIVEDLTRVFVAIKQTCH